MVQNRFRRKDREGPDNAKPPALTGGISMWGAPTSGKTTFAAAMAVALEHHPDEPWRLRGTDPASARTLGSMRSALVDKGEFPAASQAWSKYKWELVKSDPKANRPGFLGMQRRDRTVRIPLHLMDGPGRYQDPERWLDAPDASSIVDTMANCSGFVFLYDPVREYEDGDAYQHTGSLLARLDHRLGDRRGGFLPQCLAVCVTKFDDERVYASAEAARVVDHDYVGNGTPYVDEDYAEGFFERICRASPNPSAQNLPKLLRRHFGDDKIRFFVTSATGFYVNPSTKRFDPDDFVNVIQEKNQAVKIRGALNPINVMEPMLWLAEMIPTVNKNTQRPQE